MTRFGFLLVDKPAGITSFASLAPLKKAFPGVKIGHTGTLDNFATGLLLVVVGPYARLTPWYSGMDKTYLAEVRFGISTDTLDPSGKVVDTGTIPEKGEVVDAIGRFKGEISQIPPVYSAIHVKGSRASDLARKGQKPELAARTITIADIELEGWDKPTATIRVKCSSGTYIRSLARDIAKECGTVAHLTRLRRLEVGCFTLDEALPFDSGDFAGNLRSMTPEVASSMGLSIAEIPEEKLASFLNGDKGALAALGVSRLAGAEIAVFSHEGGFCGIVGEKDNRLAYKLVLPLAAL